MTPARLIYVVDDDKAVCDALALVFELDGFQVRTFEESDLFLKEQERQKPDCILLDVHMPGRSGIDLLKNLDAPNYGAPIFIISGQGDIPTAVAAIKQGALDFIEKPFVSEDVLKRVETAIEITRSADALDKTGHSFQDADKLTGRELDVVQAITDGLSNKEAGARLGISPRTVEVHRARIMGKLGAKNAADLVRIVLAGP